MTFEQATEKCKSDEHMMEAYRCIGTRDILPLSRSKLMDLKVRVGVRARSKAMALMRLRFWGSVRAA